MLRTEEKDSWTWDLITILRLWRINEEFEEQVNYNSNFDINWYIKNSDILKGHICVLRYIDILKYIIRVSWIKVSYTWWS